MDNTDDTERRIEDELYRSAAELIERRYPAGWGGAAAMRLEGRGDMPSQIVTSVAIETANAAASLCIETGAMCEAMKRDLRITHTICLVRDSENDPFTVLSPCGICQNGCDIGGTIFDAPSPVTRKMDDPCSFGWTTCNRTTGHRHTRLPNSNISVFDTPGHRRPVGRA